MAQVLHGIARGVGCGVVVGMGYRKIVEYYKEIVEYYRKLLNTIGV